MVWAGGAFFKLLRVKDARLGGIMKRLSFRPRPLDVNKKLSLVTSRYELDGDDFGRGGSSSAGRDEESAGSELVRSFDSRFLEIFLLFLAGFWL